MKLMEDIYFTYNSFWIDSKVLLIPEKWPTENVCIKLFLAMFYSLQLISVDRQRLGVRVGSKGIVLPDSAVTVTLLWISISLKQSSIDAVIWKKAYSLVTDLER